MIYVSENKATLYKGDFRPAELYKGDKRIAGYGKEAFEGEDRITLEGCYNDKLHSVILSGNSVQQNSPSPENPAEIKSVGDLVTEGEHSGKYKIRVNAYEENKAAHAFDIYLDEPLRKIGENEDFIDFESGKIIRNISAKAFTGSENWYRQDYRLYCSCGSAKGLDSNVCHLLNNRFESFTWTELAGNVRKEEGNRIIGAALQAGSYFCVTPAQTVPEIEEWKAQLKKWSDEGTPLTAVYKESAREEELALPDFPTFRGTTIYEIDTDITAKISGEYKRTGGVI